METTQTAQQRRKKKIPQQVPLPKISKHLHNLLEWYAHPDTKNIKNVSTHYSRDAFYKDPFTEVYTAAEIQNYFEHTLNRINDVRFIFENIIEEKNQAFITWTMRARFFGREFQIKGTSHLKFDSSGLCEYHQKYFDLSGEVYEQLPVLGAVFRGFRHLLN